MVYSRAALEVMKMAELRKIGESIGAKDTDKNELIEEILKTQVSGKKHPAQDMLDALERTKGDMVQTYELRDRIIDCIIRLKELEG